MRLADFYESSPVNHKYKIPWWYLYTLHRVTLMLLSHVYCRVPTFRTSALDIEQPSSYT